MTIEYKNHVTVFKGNCIPAHMHYTSMYYFFDRFIHACDQLASVSLPAIARSIPGN